MRPGSAQLVVAAAVCVARVTSSAGDDLSPEGYYLFDVAPFKTPPKVPRPPYTQTNQLCPGAVSAGGGGGLGQPRRAAESQRLIDNLCGDLQKGQLPLNPIHPGGVNGHVYPFELIKNKSLELFGSTLPILKEDPTLPKVARFAQHGKVKQQSTVGSLFTRLTRGRRSSDGQSQGHRTADDAEEEPARTGRGFCDTNWGVFCVLFKGWSRSEEEDVDPSSDRSDGGADPQPTSSGPGDTSLTPCPSTVQYVTPVFARNYEGVWRYVVQIPHEGYFTQTIEVTACRSSRCHLLEGLCLSSPRWVSMLVAELFYPHQTFPLSTGSTAPVRRDPVTGQPPPVQQHPEQYHLQQRSGTASGADTEPSHHEYCDGVDELGCYQVRLYYDWFLVPGSCKCWKQDIFAQYRSGLGRTST